MRVQFSGVYKIQPVLSDHRRSMVDAEAVQTLLQGHIDHVYLGQRPRATSFVVADEVVMVANDDKGDDYTRFLERQAQKVAHLSEPIKRWFQPPTGGPVQSGSAPSNDSSSLADIEGAMPINRLPFMMPSAGNDAEAMRKAVEAVQREFLEEATPALLFVRVSRRKAAEVAVEHLDQTPSGKESWRFQSKSPNRGLFAALFG